MENVAVIIGATGAVGRKILEEVLEKNFYKKVLFRLFLIWLIDFFNVWYYNKT